MIDTNGHARRSRDVLVASGSSTANVYLAARRALLRAAKAARRARES